MSNPISLEDQIKAKEEELDRVRGTSRYTDVMIEIAKLKSEKEVRDLAASPWISYNGAFPQGSQVNTGFPGWIWSSTRQDTFSSTPLDDRWSHDHKLQCHCGVDKVHGEFHGVDLHSTWCPKYKKF